MDRLGVLLSVAEAASQEHSPADLVRLSCLPSRWPSCYLCAWYFRRYACVQAHSLSATRHLRRCRKRSFDSMDALQGSWQQRMGLLDLTPVAAPQVLFYVRLPVCSPCTA